jgi:HEAT repeat protein
VNHLKTEYAPWRLSKDGRKLLSPREETPQPCERGLQELIATYLEPKGYQVHGEIRWDGEEPGDTGIIRVTANQLEVLPDEEEPLSKAGIEQIIGLLRSRKPEDIRQGGEILDHYAQRIPGVLEALLPHLDDPVMEVRWCSIECLMFLEEDAEPAIPALIVALNDPHEWVRSAAAATLGAIGPKAAVAISALERLKDDESYGPRGRAQEALKLIRENQAT